MLRLGGGPRRSDFRPVGGRRLGGLRLGANPWRGRLHLGRALHCRNLGLVHSGQRFAALGRLKIRIRLGR